jgi:hypothetical protein
VIDTANNDFEVSSTSTGLALLHAADAAAARTTISSPAAPIDSATALGGVGDFRELFASSGTQLDLPANGTWAFSIRLIVTSSGVLAGFFNAGVAAGGSPIGSASSGNYWEGWGLADRMSRASRGAAK